MSILSRALRLMETMAAVNTSPAPLGQYNVNPASVSVSGLSSGGSFTVQLGVAYSNLFQTGFGVFAGQPYDCARNQSYTQCKNNNVPNITLPLEHLHEWSGDQIDPISNLANRRVFYEVGTADTTVGPHVMAALEQELSHYTTSNLTKFVTLQGAVHTFPTDRKISGDSPCTTSESPFISDCSYDGAGEVLQWMYGNNLHARQTGNLTGEVVPFAQTGSYVASGMDSTGYLYVPAACSSGKTECRLHVAMHGCSQSASDIGMRFVNDTGYNLWADTNNIIMLYPQALADDRTFTIYDGKKLSNDLGCWDWLGYYGLNADQKGGVQLSAVVNQVQRIISGHKS